MMVTYRIICKVLSYDGNYIQKVGLIDNTSRNYSATPEKLNQMIENGDNCFFTNKEGKTAEVEQFGNGFIRTKADGIVSSNLRHLKDCDF